MIQMMFVLGMFAAVGLALSTTVHARAAAVVPDGVARIHYHRPDGEYRGWTLHVWEDTIEDVVWGQGLPSAGTTEYGVFWDVRLSEGAERVGLIIHNGGQKDPGPDLFLRPAEHGREIWLLSGSANIHSEEPRADTGAGNGDIDVQRAHWVARDLIAWPLQRASAGATYRLHFEEQGHLRIGTNTVEGGSSISLHPDPSGLPSEVLRKFPHLGGAIALRLDASDIDRVPEILRSRSAVSQSNQDRLIDATGLQVPGVLDDLFFYPGDLGVVWDGEVPTIKLWAPTAQSVRLHLFEGTAGEALEILDLEEGGGVWQIRGGADWKGRYYLYEVSVYVPSTQRVERNLVTDPYSMSLSMNSTRTQIVDLRDPEHKPDGWDDLAKPGLRSFADISAYEIHMRDFSVIDETVRPEFRGKYLAFTEPDSRGIRHLRALAEAGLTHLHLLPTFDIATIEEDEGRQVKPSLEELAKYPPDSAEQRRIVQRLRDRDGYNWGYDPFHFNVPEGSYSTDPDGPRRIREYRQMILAINELGLRFVKDVVYNHTHAAGQSDKSVFDRIVPGYYHRLDEQGFVHTSTCCPNTATEHAMMEKFMIDSLVLWAREYKIDSFRFDLMGHHMVENMMNARDALDALTVEEDGVDGRSIYVYGEGWNFGEVVNDARGANASQFNMAGSGIGTFNDRMRDAVRSSGPFDEPADMIRNQGFISGLYFDSNENNPMNRHPLVGEEARQRLLLLGDQIKVGLAGNLRDFRFIDRSGREVRGYDVEYGGGPSGYALTPLDTINYIEKHDNQTLFDVLVMKVPVERTLDERVSIQNLGTSMVALAQGIPFFHAGQDMLRSKSMERDSYNSGDWFNRLDFSYRDNNFGVGLPPDVPPEQFRYLRPYLANADLVPESRHILRAVEHFREILQIRYSSPLFRLESAEEIMTRLSFHNTGPGQIPGLIVMRLSDREGQSIDPAYQSIVVLFNATHEPVEYSEALFSGAQFQLHPILARATDPVVREATFDAGDGAFTVPPRTTAVFVERR
jgi:pullulanase